MVITALEAAKLGQLVGASTTNGGKPELFLDHKSFIAIRNNRFGAYFEKAFENNIGLGLRLSADTSRPTSPGENVARVFGLKRGREGIVSLDDIRE